MTLADNRPDPDALLQRMQEEGARAGRGKLRVYFGASAGVGKTFAMLTAARALRTQGVDVVVGVVETHGRAETEALVAGLDSVPLREMPYRDRILKEFDLDGVLARHPALVLVDELAHTNAAGSRHPKRWQDIAELLAAGIDVWTTVNVQHLESLNQAVGGITGVRVWETVPDAVFDDADDVVLVDLPADELLRRLREGKVYLPEQARHAARNFFRKGNLIALRELALRRTADRVDDDVRAYRDAQSIEPVWRTREALVACIGTGDDAEQVVRSARRLASQLDCDWHVVTIATPRLVPLSTEVRTRVRAAMRLAEELGARTETLAGHDMVRAVTGYVRRHNLTKVLVGRARTDWQHEGGWLEQGRMLLGRALSPVLGAGNRLIGRQTFADALAAGCPEIDVIRVAADTTRAAPLPATQGLPAGAMSEENVAESGTRRLDYVWSVAWCAGATLLSTFARPWFDIVNIAMLFLAAVVGVALRHGRGPAALASVLSVGAFDFFFVPPRLSFAVSDVQYLLTFVVLLTVGLVIGQLTAGLREQASVAVRRETDARTLYELARELSAALTTQQIVEIGGRFLRAAFDAHASFFLVSASGRLLPVADPNETSPKEGRTTKGEAIDTVLAQWVFDHGEAAGTGTHTLPGSTVLYLPLKAPMQTRGVLAVEPHDWGALADPALRRQADVFATLIAIAIERLHYVEVAQQALVSIESEQLRSSLLAAVSHDLRTPLTGLIGMAESLARAPLPADVAATVDAMRVQAHRMRTMVVNLLDMARLQRHDVSLTRGWQSMEELVGAALAAMREALAGHPVQVSGLAALPLVECDAVLVERVLCNLLENAAKYTPPGTTVRIGGAVAGEMVQVFVEDDGPGVPVGQERRIFEKFTRGAHESATAGVGLGLAVCDAILQAHDGRIWVEPVHGAAPHGARFTLALPRGNPPDIEPETLHDLNDLNDLSDLNQVARTEPLNEMPFDYSPTVLLVEDEPHIRRFVRESLQAEGCTVHEAETLKRGLIDAGTRQPDVVILDLGLPDGDGMTLIREMRTWTQVPVLVLSARTEEADKIAALDAGADDYLTKPFGVGELVARVRVLLRRHARANPQGTPTIAFGDVQVDLANRLVTRAEAPVHLTPIEYRLLAVLIAHRGKVMTHRELLREVWGPSHAESSHYLRVYMGHLRHKLESDPAQPAHLLTEVGVGYRFAA